MVSRSPHFDLGRDKTRIKDPRDADRQQRTVDVVLERFFASKPSQRFEIQILADEVGMGKTFVALGVAYSILAHLKQAKTEPDLDGCYHRVLVLTPNNQALHRKWLREVAEFERRCVLPEYKDGQLAFSSLRIDRLDDLAVALRKPGRQPQVIVARMGLFGGDKLLNYELKRQFTLGVLFRFWGVRFNYEQRERLLKGVPPGWPTRADNLTAVSETQDEQLPFSEEDLLSILNRLTAKDLEEVDSLLNECREVATPFFHNRADEFPKIERRLIDIYRLAALKSIQRDFPLIVVDEAHNWKNGPLAGANGFRDFSTYIAPHVRRALLLTATPFQLRPDEMLEILKISDFMQPCPTQDASAPRVARLTQFREMIVRPVLKNSENHSRAFSRAWARIPRKISSEAIADVWGSADLVQARKRLLSLAQREGVVTVREVEIRTAIESTLAGIDPDIRGFLREALRLYVFNADLSCELGKLVIRHRRRTDHRLFRVGNEYELDSVTTLSRPDAHVLHAAPGLDIRGEAELPQYLLMRCVSEMKGGKGRSSLGSDLTGCYSTLHESSEGRNIQSSLKESPVGRLYLALLSSMVSRREDPKHPKLSRVVSEAVQHWRSGEKVLIFCFRINTAERLRDIIGQRIGEELETRRKKCLGGEGQLKTLRSRLTGRDRDLIGLGLDRVLWSAAWAKRHDCALRPEEFILLDEELLELARLSRLFQVAVSGERVDRVFLNRVTEHLLAQRFSKLDCGDDLNRLLKRMSSLNWIANPYGLQHESVDEEQGEETTSFDERGCNTSYPAGEHEPTAAESTVYAEALKATRDRARVQRQVPLLDSYALAPSLWLGADPKSGWQEAEPSRTRIPCSSSVGRT